MAEDAGTDYSAAVVRTLVEEFSALADPSTAGIVKDAIDRQRRQPVPMFGCFVDNLAASNWKLVPHRTDPRRVQLSCLRLHPTAADQQRELRLNQALDQLPA